MHLTRSFEGEPQSVNHQTESTKRILTPPGSAPGLPRVAIATLGPDSTIESHTHPDLAEYFYVLKGSVRFIIDESPYTLSEGDFIVIESGERHALEVIGDTPCQLLYWGQKNPAT